MELSTELSILIFVAVILGIIAGLTLYILDILVYSFDPRRVLCHHLAAMLDWMLKTTGKSLLDDTGLSAYYADWKRYATEPELELPAPFDVYARDSLDLLISAARRLEIKDKQPVQWCFQELSAIRNTAYFWNRPHEDRSALKRTALFSVSILKRLYKTSL